jgi:hypothetical protein
MQISDSNGEKDFAQPERKQYEELFSRRSREGPVGIQTRDEYEDEMRGIEAALREMGANL